MQLLYQKMILRKNEKFSSCTPLFKKISPFIEVVNNVQLWILNAIIVKISNTELKFSFGCSKSPATVYILLSSSYTDRIYFEYLTDHVTLVITKNLGNTQQKIITFWKKKMRSYKTTISKKVSLLGERRHSSLQTKTIETSEWKNKRFQEIDNILQSGFGWKWKLCYW